MDIWCIQDGGNKVDYKRGFYVYIWGKLGGRKHVLYPRGIHVDKSGKLVDPPVHHISTRYTRGYYVECPLG